jgi:3-hydroxyacyl-CoA dehydrogenase
MFSDFKSVGIIGTGVIGSSWAAFYSMTGMEVKMYDLDGRSRRKGLERATNFIDGINAGGLITDEQQKIAVSKLKTAETLEETAEDVDVIQESVAENYSVKHNVFKIADAASRPETVIMSSSSGLLMTEIQKAAQHPERCLIAHPFNPPHLIPLVELVPGKQTDEKILLDVKAFFEAAGKTPVVLKKEVPGHIANRLSAALWREAVDIVLKGVADVGDVDKALRAGPGLRWALMGPHLTYHLGGGEGGIKHFIDHLGPAFATWLKDMAVWTEFPPESRDILHEGVQKEVEGRNQAELAKWRDEKLTELIKLLYK